MMGSTFRFIHCADLHLGSRFKGLDSVNPEMAARLRQSVFDSFGRIVDKALNERVDALVISGDLYDDRNELPSTRAWLCRQLSRLSIPVFICRGNHDVQTTWDESIPYPDNVHEFPMEPEKVDINDDVEIIGVSYRERNETRNLATQMQGTDGKFTIACLHCDIDSVSEGHPYAQCTLSDLRGRGVDYWALGHIHKRTVVSEQPYIVYPGNIQGRSFKAPGAKGAYLVTVTSGRVTGLDFFSTQGYIWKDILIDITDRDFNDIISELRTMLSRTTISRITFTGSGKLNAMLRKAGDDVRKTIEESTGSTVSTIRVRTSPEIDLEARAEGKDMAAAIIRAGRDMESMSREEIIDIICHNKVAARYRPEFESMSDKKLKGIVTDAMRDVLTRMEAGR